MDEYLQFALEAIIISILIYYVSLLYRRQRKTKATADRVVFLAGILICAGYPVLLTYYFEETGFIWSLSDWYALGYYTMIILTEAILIYSYMRVEQNAERLEADLIKKAHEIVDAENQQRDAEEKITREHTSALIDGAHQVSTVLRENVRKPLKTMRQALYHLREDPEGADLALKTLDENLNVIEGAVEEISSTTSFGQLKKTLVDISELVNKIIDETKVPDGVKVEADLGEGFSALNVDAPRLKRALANIVDNAVEAMPGGGTLKVEVSKDKNEIVIKVSDTGVGIPESAKGMIFKPFYTTKPHGLGLFYSKDIIEAHGGKIDYSSTEEKGTTFTVKLPLIA
ncbi:MAG: sensor histidine kinase [Candidatus Bathyarchaeota archaeon]|nr:sensor histidine kinase [Candidatus Bathyarchaeota archaeon]